ncbi:MAG: hypothetical protein KJ941_02430, partial [Bacteroidetes bacterium]|nr:hypothetical protein [Bacteroidota bacterium]
MKLNLSQITLLLVLLALFSCKQTTKEKKVSESIKENNVTNEDIIRTFYNIPSPSEQLNRLRELDGADVFNNLLSPNDVYLYNTQKRRLIVFGSYAADASYLASKSRKGQIVNYLAVLRTLSNDLGMQNLLSDKLLESITKPNQSADSLFLMADKYYINAFDQMITSNKGADLGLILFGGWLETMNITLQSSYGFNKSTKINEFIADQKLVAENLMSYLLDYQENESVTGIVEDMGDILTLYERMDCTYTETQVKKSGQNLTLNGGTKCVLTKEVYSEMKVMISELRNEYTK